jgi:hypothetical protein
MPIVVKNHDYPGYEALGNVFNISTATSFKLSQDVTIVATSGQIGEAASYSPF